jgi:hypothetical protein
MATTSFILLLLLLSFSDVEEEEEEEEVVYLIVTFSYKLFSNHTFAAITNPHQDFSSERLLLD